ncbi:Dihydroxy-acid dehydratase [Tetrabaena socialis]|uniref:Dihydroxy-acid dehydratase n=1 Tax=Tetrabaena socialis TaxID=47790 RepID=A0A2J7ZW48_9CHLO|nr:Dihydroxy-acid dehydratase [Tetrabaena socialis]|eukprot:PNH04490.1 Dihydroxy-acid dehydratase [Tetrabaena socialis]
MPGTLMAMSRLNRPSLMIYGGTIKPGHASSDGAVLDIVSAFQSYGACGRALDRIGQVQEWGREWGRGEVT